MTSRARLLRRKEKASYLVSFNGASFLTLEQGVLYFHFVLGPEKYVTIPVCPFWPESKSNFGFSQGALTFPAIYSSSVYLANNPSPHLKPRENVSPQAEMQNTRGKSKH